MTSNSDTAIRWLVGVDLHGRAGGAVAFARWLAARAKGDELLGVHVFGEALLDGADPSVDVGQLQKLFDASLASLRGDGCFAELGLHPAKTIIEGLAEVAEEKHADALVVGRIKRTDRVALSRLGRVARRLLRSLPRPVVVVPPDLDADRIGDGPIVLATDLTEGSVGAARFATRLAEHLGLPMLVVHVVPLPSDYQALMPPPQLRTVVERFSTGGTEALDRWAAEHVPTEARRRATIGSVEFEIMDALRQANGSMLVVGAHGRSTVSRLFAPSMASEMAAAAPVPVAVVPPDYGKST